MRHIRYEVVSLILIAMILGGTSALFSTHVLAAPWQGYAKPAFTDYAPSGMPDFDEKQDHWGPVAGTYTWCVPVAVADSLWWLDSEYESKNYSNPVAPPTISDHFNLVTTYNSTWDDHNSSNVDPLVRNLAALMHTDQGHVGTLWTDVAPGIQAYLVQQGVDSLFEVHQMDFPVFPWIDAQVTQCQDVELFLEFWYFNLGTWQKTTNPNFESGHCVAVAGSNATTNQVLVSDPYYDVSAPAVNSAVHNDAQYVLQDPYTTVQTVFPPNPIPPGYPPSVLELQNYGLLTSGDPNLRAFVRGAVATSPIPVHDVAVTDLTSLKTVVFRGFCDNLTATAQNLGDSTENFNVTVYANTTIITTLNFNLASGSSATQPLLWNTSSFAYANYTLNAVADTVPGETNTTNNNFTALGRVRMSIVGDLTGRTDNPYDFVPDGKVLIVDVSVVSKLFGQKSPPAAANCDVTGITLTVPDGKILIDDVATVSKHYAEHE